MPNPQYALALQIMDEAWEGVSWRNVNTQPGKLPRTVMKELTNVTDAPAKRSAAIKRLKKIIREAHEAGGQIMPPQPMLFAALEQVSGNCDTPTSIVSTVTATHSVVIAHLAAAKPESNSKKVLLDCAVLLSRYQEVPQS